MGEPRPSQIDASALALAAEVSDPQQTRVMRRATTENNMMGAAALVRIGAAASGGGTSPVDGKAARSGKATKVALHPQLVLLSSEIAPFPFIRSWRPHCGPCS